MLYLHLASNSIFLLLFFVFVVIILLIPFFIPLFLYSNCFPTFLPSRYFVLSSPLSLLLFSLFVFIFHVIHQFCFVFPFLHYRQCFFFLGSSRSFLMFCLFSAVCMCFPRHYFLPSFLPFLSIHTSFPLYFPSPFVPV